MAEIRQLLSASVKFPIQSASEEEKALFADKSEAVKNGYFYRFELTSGATFVGCFDTKNREVFFRSDSPELSALKEIQYVSKYVYHRPELMARIALKQDCPLSEREAYHAAFDSQPTNFSDPDRICFHNHGLGQLAQQMFTPLQAIEQAKGMWMQGQTALQQVLTGHERMQQNIQQFSRERRQNG